MAAHAQELVRPKATVSGPGTCDDLAGRLDRLSGRHMMLALQGANAGTHRQSAIRNMNLSWPSLRAIVELSEMRIERPRCFGCDSFAKITPRHTASRIIPTTFWIVSTTAEEPHTPTTRAPKPMVACTANRLTLLTLLLAALVPPLAIRFRVTFHCSLSLCCMVRAAPGRMLAWSETRWNHERRCHCHLPGDLCAGGSTVLCDRCIFDTAATQAGGRWPGSRHTQ